MFRFAPEPRKIATIEGTNHTNQPVIASTSAVIAAGS